MGQENAEKTNGTSSTVEAANTDASTISPDTTEVPRKQENSSASSVQTPRRSESTKSATKKDSTLLQGSGMRSATEAKSSTTTETKKEDRSSSVKESKSEVSEKNLLVKKLKKPTSMGLIPANILGSGSLETIKEERDADHERGRSQLLQQSTIGGSLSSLSSRAKEVVGSRISIKIVGVLEGSVGSKFTRYMNTYKLFANKPFKPHYILKTLEEIVDEVLKTGYDFDSNKDKVKWMVSSARSAIKACEFDRYKFICVATIGQKHSQDVFITFKGLWDPQKDNFAFIAKERADMFALVMCFGIYFD